MDFGENGWAGQRDEGASGVGIEIEQPRRGRKLGARWNTGGTCPSRELPLRGTAREDARPTSEGATPGSPSDCLSAESRLSPARKLTAEQRACASELRYPLSPSQDGYFDFDV